MGRTAAQEEKGAVRTNQERWEIRLMEIGRGQGLVRPAIRAIAAVVVLGEEPGGRTGLNNSCVAKSAGARGSCVELAETPCLKSGGR